MGARGPRPVNDEPVTGAEREARRRAKLKRQREIRSAKEIRMPFSESALAVLKDLADEKEMCY